MKTQIILFSIGMALVNGPGSSDTALLESSGQTMNAKVTLDGSFTFLRTHRQGKGVTVIWGFAAANEVAGFQVQRTYEDPNDPYAFWEDIASVPFASLRSFKYTDQQVFPGYINYRVIALMTDGSSIVSEVSGVRIVSH